MLPIGDEGSARRSFPFVTIALIVLNVFIFFNELSGGEPFILRWAFIPVRFVSNPVTDSVTLISSMFIHAGWLHLAGNMLYLWIFGDNIEDRFGHLKFILFYILCGLAAAFAQFFSNPQSVIPTLGASGAIAGVLGAYFILFPTRRVMVLLPFGIFHVSALIVIGFWIVLQAFNSLGSLSSASTGGVAYMAHVGGFIAGLFLVMMFRSGQGRSITL
jgi:membrane associated rhomboid family serine protease